MWILLLELTFGLVASSWASSVQEVTLRGCSYLGVFHIQGNNRYSLDLDNAQKLCEALGTTLASNENVTAAHAVGYETCRYGWVSSGNITIPRHVPNAMCAANLTGIITLVPTDSDSQYDAYCYDKTDLFEKNCTFEIKYLENDEPGNTENNKSIYLNHSVTPTVVPVERLTSTVADNETIHTMEEKTPTPSSSHGENDGSGDMLDQNTQPPTMTAEPTTKSDDLSTEIHAGKIGGDNEEHITIIPSLDSNGSGMGEPTHSTTSESDTGDSVSTAATSEDKAVNSRESVHKTGRKGTDEALPPMQDGSSESTTDWMVILFVVLAIALILLLCAIVVMKKRGCGRSKTLNINSKGISEGNGAAPSVASSQAQEREQEMVTLMNKEKIQENGNTEEFTVITLEESPEKNQQA